MTTDGTQWTPRMMFDIGVGERIKARRTDLGMTLTELAKRANASKGQLSMVENGQRGMTIWTAYAVAKALGLSMDALVEDL